MTTTAILKDGTPVRIHLFEKPAFDVEGFLVGFTLSSLNSEEYRYYQQSEFKREDRKKPNLSGYYDKTMFLKYIQNVEPVPTLDKLVKYNFERVLATEGEEITVTSIDFEEPYDYFYNEKKYTFNLQNTIDNRGVRNYLKPIVEDFRTVDYKINTDGANAVIVLNNQSALPGGYFYKKNLGDFINTWSITNTQKTLIKKTMGLIIFKIREINRDIIPLIASNTHFFEKEQDVANGIIDYNDFTDLEKLLFNFKRTWGYYYDTPLNGLPRPYKDSFEALFSNSSTLEDYQSYLSSLQNFYQICNKTKNLAYYPADEKVEYLLKILSPSALNVIPYELIIKCIKQYLKFNLSQEDQRVLVKLVISIKLSHANDFLDFLLEKENGAETNFQVIYDTLTDARLERYPFVNWFVNEQPNRMYFAFAIYELWKISKYNLDYIRPGIVIPHPWPYYKGVDPDNYFNVNPQEFSEKNFLTFILSSDQQIVTSQQRFESSLNDKKIDITKISKQDTNTGYYNQPKIGPEHFGSFHLYQQISFCGYESNLDLRIPTSATLPAFLFHFIEEYDRLADFDAGVALAANLTVDALLIYFTGGTSILKDLQYLKYTTKIGRALAGGIESTEAIEIWQGFKGTADIFTLTASSLMHINQYLITTENNEQKRKILEGCQKIFLSLTFLGVGLSVAAQAHAVSEAGKVLDLIEALPSGVAHGLAPEMINLLTTLKGNKDVTLSLFGNKLNTLDLGDATNYILIKYNSVFTDAQRLKFLKDFQDIDDLAFWRLLNNGRNASGIRDGSFIDNWISLSERGLEEAKITTYICNQRRTDALIRYVDEPITKPVINNLSYEKRLAFINNNGDAGSFAVYAENPNLIKEWEKYSFVSKGNDLSILSAEQKFKFLKSYENSTQAVVDKIKNGGLIKYFKIVDDNPLNAIVQNSHIKNVDFLEDVRNTFTLRKQYPFDHVYHPGLQETIANHIKGSPVMLNHNGSDYIIGFTGMHADYAVTELNPITLIEATLPGGKKYYPNPLPTVNANIQTAIKDGTEIVGVGAKDCEVWMWGYVTKKVDGIESLYLDSNGNPIKTWVKKSNSNKTTIFMGMNEDKVLIEIAYARHNLTVADWIQIRSNRSSNTWVGKTSEGGNIHLCIGTEVMIRPTAIPSRTLPYGTVIPKR
ncbi:MULTISPECIES: hypothetical protein [Flavobacterium]|uniref:hypothetical protein n=1 Tax=Flavobacterium TaxID=237 RepID=UPI001181E184|nr:MULTISPECIES: hypothetical protein [Flavobacterium]MCR4030723.1 hypothetical protein [Flavobacterium panacis]